MNTMEQTLTWHELSLAMHAGAQRNLQARVHKRPDTYGKDVRDLEGGWGLHIEGAAAEMVVAKALGLYWDPVWGAIDRTRGDVGAVQVRSTLRSGGSLILHESDADESPFILVVGPAPYARIIGWILGRDGKDARYWRDDTGRPAFFVPQQALRPMERLPALIEEMRRSQGTAERLAV